jgi:hypothetical protein
MWHDDGTGLTGDPCIVALESDFIRLPWVGGTGVRTSQVHFGAAIVVVGLVAALAPGSVVAAQLKLRPGPRAIANTTQISEVVVKATSRQVKVLSLMASKSEPYANPEGMHNAAVRLQGTASSE